MGRCGVGKGGGTRKEGSVWGAEREKAKGEDMEHSFRCMQRGEGSMRRLREVRGVDLSHSIQ